jgi:hypothetical protein
MIVPTDIWKEDVMLDGLRGEDGRLDSAKVSEAIDGVLRDRPHLKRRPGRGDSGARGPERPQRRQPGLADLLKP